MVMLSILVEKVLVVINKILLDLYFRPILQFNVVFNRKALNGNIKFRPSFVVGVEKCLSRSYPLLIFLFIEHRIESKNIMSYLLDDFFLILNHILLIIFNFYIIFDQLTNYIKWNNRYPSLTLSNFSNSILWSIQSHKTTAKSYKKFSANKLTWKTPLSFVTIFSHRTLQSCCRRME